MNYIGLESKDFEEQASNMNKLLATFQVYYQNLRSFHWHVKGENFFELHGLFEMYYNDAKLNIDELAERILTLSFKPIGNMSTYLLLSEISEAQDEMEDREMVKIVLDNHLKLLGLMRDVIRLAKENEDNATTDMLLGFIKNMEKKSWQLNAWTKKSVHQLLN